MKARVNPITRQAIISIKDKDCLGEYELFFDDLDCWNAFEHNGQTYDVHFHYEEQMWFHIYEKENYEKQINFELIYFYSDEPKL